jgi:hypothetical protein
MTSSLKYTRDVLICPTPIRLTSREPDRDGAISTHGVTSDAAAARGGHHLTSFLTSFSRHLAAELGAKSGADARFAPLTPSDVGSEGVEVLLREQEVAGSNPVAPTDSCESPAIVSVCGAFYSQIAMVRSPTGSPGPRLVLTVVGRPRGNCHEGACH